MLEHHEFECEVCDFRSPHKSVAGRCEARPVISKYQVQQKIFFRGEYEGTYREHFSYIIKINVNPWSHTVRDYNITDTHGMAMIGIKESNIFPFPQG